MLRLSVSFDPPEQGPRIRVCWPLLFLLCGWLLLALACGGEKSLPGSIGAKADDIRLVVVLVIDQLRPERIHGDLPGGLGRLMSEGHNFPRAEQNHARTETCPGHATILTGRYPGSAGIPGNYFIDRSARETVYCVADKTEQGQILGEGQPQDSRFGRSPANLRVDTLGDWIKNVDPQARVFAVSGKDRAAIMLAGHQADAAYWLDRNHTGQFTTSRYYQDSLPAWVREWTVDHLFSGVPHEWAHSRGLSKESLRKDDYPGEDDSFGRSTPHRIKREGDFSTSMEAFSYSPYLDRRTLDFAKQLVSEEVLGAAGRTDLLAISLSGTDLIGHAYGPFSHESTDALRILDDDLGQFLVFLEKRVGQEHLLVVLSADHGVLALPEWLDEGSSPCPVSPSRISPSQLGAALSGHLDEHFGVGRGPWFIRNHLGFFFLPQASGEEEFDPSGVQQVAADWLKAQPGVATVVSRERIGSGWSRSPLASLHEKSQADDRGPDLLVEGEYGCLLSDYPTGTSHGSPHDYDRRVPLVFFGAGVKAGETWSQVETVDIAPTLAKAISLPVPAGLDGKALVLGE